MSWSTFTISLFHISAYLVWAVDLVISLGLLQLLLFVVKFCRGLVVLKPVGVICNTCIHFKKKKKEEKYSLDFDLVKSETTSLRKGKMFILLWDSQSPKNSLKLLLYWSLLWWFHPVPLSFMTLLLSCIHVWVQEREIWTSCHYSADFSIFISINFSYEKSLPG